MFAAPLNLLVATVLVGLLLAVVTIFLRTLTGRPGGRPLLRCTGCGHRNAPAASFCARCGRRLD